MPRCSSGWPSGRGRVRRFPDARRSGPAKPAPTCSTRWSRRRRHGRSRHSLLRSGRRWPGDPGGGSARARRRRSNRRLPRPHRRLPRAPPGHPARHPDLCQYRRRSARLHARCRPGWRRQPADCRCARARGRPLHARNGAGRDRAGADRRREYARRRRSQRIAQLSKAYTYCVSRAGITGTHAGGQFDSGLIDRAARRRRAAAGVRLRDLQAGACRGPLSKPARRV